jgi:hypothetical protein
MLAPNIVIQRFVNGMSVECPNHCPQKPSRSDLESHVRVCELRPEVVARQRQERLSLLTSRIETQRSLASTGKAKASDLLSLSRDLLACNDFANAQFMAEKALQAGGGGTEASEQLADVLFAAGSWKAALDTFPASCVAKRAECQIKLGL